MWGLADRLRRILPILPHNIFKDWDGWMDEKMFFFTILMIDKLHASHKESADRAGLTGGADPITDGVDGEARPGVKMRRRFVGRFGHQSTDVTIVGLHKNKRRFR